MQAYVLSHFSCVRLCDPMICSLLGSSVHGILEARLLEWVAVPPSRDRTTSLHVYLHWQKGSLPLALFRKANKLKYDKANNNSLSLSRGRERVIAITKEYCSGSLIATYKILLQGWLSHLPVIESLLPD